MARRGKRKLSEAQAEPQAKLQVTQTASAGQTELPVEPATKRVQTRREIFVRGLAYTVTSDSLVTHFSESFPIRRGFVVVDPTTKQCKGYGFVTFADADDAAQAVTQFQGSSLQGRKIRLEVAEPRHREVDDTLPTEIAVASGKNRSVPAPQAIAAKEKRKQELDAKHNKGKPPRLIIRNLPWTIKTEADLEKLFLSFGKVKSVNLPKKGPGLLRGFGFVLLRGRQNAEKALTAMNGKQVDGRPIAVDWAVDKDTWESQTADPTPALNENTKAITSTSGSARRASAIDVPIDSGSDHGDEADDADGVAPLGMEESDANANEESLSEIGDQSDVSDEQRLKIKVPEASKEAVAPNTLFVRNLPFSTSDADLQAHFASFGPLRYARVVLDPGTERPRGTAFVCFRNPDDAKECLRNAPRSVSNDGLRTGGGGMSTSQSILQDVNADPQGKYTLEGRVLQLARAVEKSQALHLANAGTAVHEQLVKDKRRLYLLHEGTISTQSEMWEALSPAEKAMRESSLKQRKALIQSNPSLHLSLTRLSVRNIPRTISSKMLRDLAVQAVVGFATDVKAGRREKLSKEELNRGGDSMHEAEKSRKLKRKGIVKQAMIVFETAQGSKTEEKEGGGRSRGYGFIEYHTHRSALMGLRWLNGHSIDYKISEPKKGHLTRDELQDRKKRLVVEFAIENAQVVHRRADREAKAKDQAKEFLAGDGIASAGQAKVGKSQIQTMPEGDTKPAASPKDVDKFKRRQQIITRKRMKRRERKGV